MNTSYFHSILERLWEKYSFGEKVRLLWGSVFSMEDGSIEVDQQDYGLH